ncbi:MAG: iron ABC transporter permease [Campylobacterota bacterium]|nr:iron ABC transporter permease [Campylobacterota bacterium]
MANILIGLLFILTLVISPFVGAAPLHVEDILNLKTLSSQIFFDIRLPRVIFALSAGAILALSGLLFQTLFRNVLMTPYTLGVSSGAILGAGVAIKLGLGAIFFGISSVNIFGFIGAISSILLLLQISKYLKKSISENLLLLGIALSMLYASTLMIIFYLGDPIQNDMLLRFTMGSLSIIGWSEPVVIFIISLILAATLYMYRFELQILNISEQSAKLQGVDSKRVTIILLLISSFAIGVLVSVSGPIGFVGLVIPHIVTKIYRTTVDKRVLKTALFGALFLLFCDTLTRALQTSSELPIGIITAIIGAPFFIYLIIVNAKH